MKNNIPVILLCGTENTLSIVRSMGKRDISVSVVATPDCQAFNSRYIDKSFIVPEGIATQDYFQETLLGENSALLKGSVLLACGDHGIEFIVNNHQALSKKYLLDIQKPQLQAAMLDKQATLRLAKEAGIGFPNYWNINSLDDIEVVADKIIYPAIIKPIHSHLFAKQFGVKLFQINNADELRQKAALVTKKNLEFMISELIPGPDTLLSSYYTHIDNDGHALFKFTKKVIRRMPPNFGGGCYHVTEWLPETAEKGDQFFRSIGFTGMANIEFKKDPRDGELKIIECNARYTAAQELVTRSGLDISYLVYQFLINGGNTDAKPATQTKFKKNLHYWYAREDLQSFMISFRKGDISLFQWLKSLAHFPLVFPNWNILDPKPSLVSLAKTFRNRLKRKQPKQQNQPKQPNQQPKHNQHT